MSTEIRSSLIFYLEATHPGGVTGVVTALMAEIRENRQCIVAYRDTAEMKRWTAQLSHTGCEFRPVALRNDADIVGWFDFINLLKLRRLFKSASIVHFHLHTPFCCIPAIFLARMLGPGTVIATEHYISQILFLRRRKLPLLLSWIREAKIWILMTLKKMTLRRLDRIVFVSESNRKLFLAAFGSQLASKTLSIPNGIDPRRFAQPSIERDRILSSLALPRKPSFILTVVAGLNNQKGHRYLIQAMPLILKEVPDVVALFVGEGHLVTVLQELAKSEGVGDEILFTGSRNDIPDILAISDLVALPSLFEGMPLSVLEAMAAAKAVVATNVDGTAEVVQDGITGYLVPPANVADLAGKIVELLKNEHRRLEFGQAGLRRVTEHFTLTSMRERYRTLYDQGPIRT